MSNKFCTENIFLIYILGLENNKFYVGRSGDILDCISNLVNNPSVDWIIKHKIVYIKNVEISNSLLDEDKFVKDMMLQVGIENVRGGKYNQTILSENQIKELTEEFEMRNLQKSNFYGQLNNKKSTIKETQKNFWSREDDKLLRHKFLTGTSIIDLSDIFQRSSSSIRTRIEKLNLNKQ